MKMIEDFLSMAPASAEARLEELGFSHGKGALKNIRLLCATPLKARLGEAIRFSLACPSPDGALNNIESIVREQTGGSLARFLEDEKNLPRLVTISGSSPFLSNILSRNPSYFQWLFTGGMEETKGVEAFGRELAEETSATEEFDSMARALRLYKQREFLRLGARDLLSLAAMEEVTAELSDLAGACLEAAFAFALRTLKRAFGAPCHAEEEGEKKEAQFAVIGLGKLGGRELNYSSDIDILYICSSDRGETSGAGGAGGAGGDEGSRINLHEFFTKLAVMVNKLISSVTGDGFVFRVDLDLRPDGRSGDMVNSLRSAEVYYESWGQPWERAAMIKARAVAGSMGLGERFLEMIRPFVYRKYLDFTAIEEIRGMKEKIDLSLLRRNPDTVDVKLGAGGIREVEFFCQALQLIHGGRDPRVWERGTLKAIAGLRARKYVNEADASTLSRAYKFLRDLEHRIQIREGRQTQAVPARPEELERLARMMGFKDAGSKKAGEFFWEEYKTVTSSVHEVFRSLFYKSEEASEVPERVLLLFTPDITETEAKNLLGALGFADRDQALRNLELIRSGPPGVRFSPRTRVIFEKLGPLFLHRASTSPDPDRALSNLERFISAAGARTTLYSLLMENPRITEELVKLFGTSVFLSRGLIENTDNLDMLLSEELSIPYKKKEVLTEEVLSAVLDPEKDYEERLDTLRRIRNQEIMRIGMNDIAGGLSHQEVSEQITFLAEAAIETSYRAALDELRPVYGSPGPPGPPGKTRFAVIGLGKLGSGELIYASDLDIVFVYEDPPGHEGCRTTGPRSITSHEFFVKLCQRIISVLSIRTKEGFVFNVDTRLRPSGSAGPLVVSRPSFIKYHERPTTAVWERQAFIRARAVAADVPFGTEVVKELHDVIYSKPLSADDISEMLRIRKRMEDEIAREAAGKYNIKTGKGAVVDIEFLIQALQLRHGGEERQLRTPYALEAIERLREGGLVSGEDYTVLKDAYNFYRVLEMRQRIVHDRPEGYLLKDSEETSSLARRAGYTGEGAAEALWGDYSGYREKVRAIYLKTLEGL
ncbi:MAG TPA: bifunctional [glutamate--ammonia ligase]-adenylyl-L-tyrosine phosphorylase/[glutamate--ammonia-ligase] adenylyltransferase [Thermodesulfobacteriota bacterium]|nr:bifunctional [glutamate--ammonia ligase]-adenylyl-L-tyrosine phosphorylase/[glutamate--ammonia-ligase] adenylyltransferase [Thermodesulfobacteriota bacterium]